MPAFDCNFVVDFVWATGTLWFDQFISRGAWDGACPWAALPGLFLLSHAQDHVLSLLRPVPIHARSCRTPSFWS